jgi:hypothetical protein
MPRRELQEDGRVARELPERLPAVRMQGRMNMTDNQDETDHDDKNPTDIIKAYIEALQEEED